MNWYTKVWKTYAVFTGRARRTEFWTFILINIILTSIISIVDHAISSFFGFLGFYDNFYYLSSIYALLVFIPSIAVTIRRLHDLGKTGWWCLIGLIPFIGSIWLIVLLATEGQSGANNWGPNPKTVKETTEAA